MIPNSVTTEVELVLGKVFGREIKIEAVSGVGGGCIHTACKIETTSGEYFIKFNTKSSQDNFEAESHGLSLLQSQKVISVPELIHVGQVGDHAFLLMKFIPSGLEGPEFWQQFGQNLAALHRNTSPKFGLDRSNFIGSLPQINDWEINWIDFFIQKRIEPMLRLASKKGLVEPELRRQFEAVFSKLPELMPPGSASLLHGDLWSGNFLVGLQGEAIILDPAVYYGHREAEIAFTQLFGGFSQNFYDAYNEAWPLQTGWQSRSDLFNLYPLLVHLNLFGSSYLNSIKSILKKYF